MTLPTVLVIIIVINVRVILAPDIVVDLMIFSSYGIDTWIAVNAVVTNEIHVVSHVSAPVTPLHAL